MVRYVDIEGNRTMMARDGWVLLEGPTRVAVVAMLQERQKRSVWPEPVDITTSEEKWRSSVVGDHLLIERTSGAKSLTPRALIAPDGYISADESLLPMIEALNLVATQMRR